MSYFLPTGHCSEHETAFTVLVARALWPSDLQFSTTAGRLPWTRRLNLVVTTSSRHLYSMLEEFAQNRVVSVNNSKVLEAKSVGASDVSRYIRSHCTAPGRHPSLTSSSSSWLSLTGTHTLEQVSHVVYKGDCACPLHLLTVPAVSPPALLILFSLIAPLPHGHLLALPLHLVSSRHSTVPAPSSFKFHCFILPSPCWSILSLLAVSLSSCYVHNRSPLPTSGKT